MVTALLTGITGSGASYLAEYLLSLGYEVHGISRWHSTSSDKNISSIKDKLHLHECDLNDLGSTVRAIRLSKPDEIYHLAAHANVRVSFDSPVSVLNNNVNSTINLLEAIRICGHSCRLQLCGTSEVYGRVSGSTAISEGFPLDPVNVYAVSKLTQEKLALAYYHSFDLNVIITRMFTYINPRRADIFATAFARQIVKIERGQQKILRHGNLDSVRTVIDVRDAMRSYHVAMQKCEMGTPYNIGGTYTAKVGKILEQLIARAKCPIELYEDKNLFRPVDVTMQIPDTTKFTTKTGFVPTIDIEESLDFLMDYVRNNE